MQSLVEIGPVVLELKIFKFLHCDFAILLFYPLGERCSPLFKETWIAFIQDALCQVWLKLAQWFWRRSCKCKKFQTDSQTDRQQAIRKAHLIFLLRLAKNQIFRVPEWMIVFSKPFSAPNYQPFCQLFLLQIEHFDCTV